MMGQHLSWLCRMVGWWTVEPHVGTDRRSDAQGVFQS